MNACNNTSANGHTCELEAWHDGKHLDNGASWYSVDSSGAVIASQPAPVEVEPATNTTVYPVKVGRGAAVHAAGYIGGDFNEVQNWTACGTTSPSLNRAVRRESATPVEITCTKCLKVDPARRR